ncbi:hypothetical protein [Vibrio cyclitrophicus]|uniref:hypothetical protein n=1 Tax=Vibrio cyclitrophicus TaxID=47951 RepID=UPI0004924500|nr:hypothetical protein [Vibrio cyclitrophicus]OEF29298.1 hypothetical protein OA9_23635 [Vibrio cyclitrophicus 1F97]
MSSFPFYLYKISSFLYRHKLILLSKIVVLINRLLFGAYIPASCILSNNVRFGYGGSGVVLHGRARIGENTIICPGVVIGGSSKHIDVPVIGDNCFIAPGAKIIGSISIGSGVFIAPNSVVITNVPNDCLVAGIPAEIKKENITISDYM